MVGATVYDSISNSGAVTNEYGFYSLTSKTPYVILHCSYVGYNSSRLALEYALDTSYNIYLASNLQLEEVIISAESSRSDLSTSQMSYHNLNNLDVHKVPALLGEPDLIKSMQYLPGVSSGNEGTSGLFIRGGGSDQNLILLDGVPVYNVNHLFGFFSVFNGNAINSASIYKAGFPARYSGRLSSVLDIRLKEGNVKEFHGAASIGLISSSFLFEGPIIRDRTSFLVSARRTYADLLSYPVQYIINQSENNSSYFGYYFHDLNAKINHRFSDRSRLYFSTYTGKDEFYMKDIYEFSNEDGTGDERLKSKEGFNWGNWTSALRWNYIWGDRLFSNATVSYSTYKFRQFEERTFYFDYADYPQLESDKGRGKGKSKDIYYSGIKDLSGRFDFSFIPSTKQTIRSGLKTTRYMFEPGVEVSLDKVNGWQVDYSIGADTVNANELTWYIEDEFQVGERFKANLGFSTTLFLVDNTSYYSLEPRISASYQIAENIAVKSSYSKMSQYIHLLTNSTIGLPTDIWVPTTRMIPPEESWQLALGIQYLMKPQLKISIEAFYKDMRNLVEYAEGAEILLNDKNWESKIVIGDGEVYGAELFVEKTYGKTTGSFAYTLSKNTRHFEEIDNGRPFPYKYDRRHDLSLLVNYTINSRISIGAVWVFASGINTTIQEQSYLNPLILSNGEQEEGILGSSDLIRNFVVRNGYKMPAYHRLDLGVNFEKEKKRFNRTLSMGAYNVYNRKNAFYIYTSQGKWFDTGQWEKRVYQATLFPLIPYIRYTIKF